MKTVTVQKLLEIKRWKDFFENKYLFVIKSDGSVIKLKTSRSSDFNYIGNILSGKNMIHFGVLINRRGPLELLI